MAKLPVEIKGNAVALVCKRRPGMLWQEAEAEVLAAFDRAVPQWYTLSTGEGVYLTSLFGEEPIVLEVANVPSPSPHFVIRSLKTLEQAAKSGIRLDSQLPWAPGRDKVLW